MTIRHMRIVCWIPKATDTSSEYVIIVAFLLQQWSLDRDSILRYKYTACLVDKCDILLRCDTVG